jgi:hypothetical protein
MLFLTPLVGNHGKAGTPGNDWINRYTDDDRQHYYKWKNK